MQWARKKGTEITYSWRSRGKLGSISWQSLRRKGLSVANINVFCVVSTPKDRVICGRRRRIDKFETLLGAEMTKKCPWKIFCGMNVNTKIRNFNVKFKTLTRIQKIYQGFTFTHLEIIKIFVKWIICWFSLFWRIFSLSPDFPVNFENWNRNNVTLCFHEF